MPHAGCWNPWSFHNLGLSVGCIACAAGTYFSLGRAQCVKAVQLRYLNSVRERGRVGAMGEARDGSQTLSRKVRMARGSVSAARIFILPPRAGIRSNPLRRRPLPGDRAKIGGRPAGMPRNALCESSPSCLLPAAPARCAIASWGIRRQCLFLSVTALIDESKRNDKSVTSGINQALFLVQS